MGKKPPGPGPVFPLVQVCIPLLGLSKMYHSLPEHGVGEEVGTLGALVVGELLGVLVVGELLGILVVGELLGILVVGLVVGDP